ncbi:uncharacterized protein LOC115100300 [Rhinatrema bivittatum]|uniref:uncharacterized protein LOC115100300 n=1 Tax=Rhinatrema bivittatum TaxID=194408 RepID=UPI00112BAE51|nr:uncharacterized protein LOC115100300 [Rhinatrema bivittatum]
MAGAQQKESVADCNDYNKEGQTRREEATELHAECKQAPGQVEDILGAKSLKEQRRKQNAIYFSMIDHRWLYEEEEEEALKARRKVRKLLVKRCLGCDHGRRRKRIALWDSAEERGDPWLEHVTDSSDTETEASYPLCVPESPWQSTDISDDDFPFGHSPTFTDLDASNGYFPYYRTDGELSNSPDSPDSSFSSAEAEEGKLEREENGRVRGNEGRR